MTFDIETDGIKRPLMVAREGRKYKVVSAGTSYLVDAAQVDDTWSLLIGSGQEGSLDTGIEGRRSYDVALGPERNGERIVYVNGRAVTVRLAEQAGRLGTAARRAGGPPSGGVDTRQGVIDVVAPMPGRVVKVLVKAGDLVSAGQGVAVVEAMKMENEVRAPRAGTVKEVRVTQGALVEARAVLAVIE